MNDWLARAEALFHQALELPPEERERFLQDACGEDAELRREVAALLRASGIANQWINDARCGAAAPSIGLSLHQSISEGPGTVVGRYKLLEKIGEGGFGVVYMAEQEAPVRRRVALKVIKLGMDTKQVVARFEAERQALALMDHPSIAKVLDAGATETGRPFFVMELVRGIKITEYCDQNHLSTERRLDLFNQVCQAVQHAHQKGIIHRDLKPSNILVTLDDGVPHPMVIDFGVAKAINQRLTEKTLFTNFAQMIGTPAYMSPEQAEMSKLDVDTRSDLYSLGVLLYELLTGTTPFPEERLRNAGYVEMQRIICEEEPEKPSTRATQIRRRAENSDEESRASPPRLLQQRKSAFRTAHSGIPTDLDWIVMKCLEKDRNRRYDTANGLVADLKRHLANEPVEARPPSTTYRLQKAFRRNKLAFTAATVMVAALVAGLAVSAWQATVATRAKKRADTARVAEIQQRVRAEAGERSGEQLLYAANMNLAQQAWEQNNIGRVRQLLNETAAYPDRGFEWYYWQRQTHLEIMTFRGHSDGVWAVAFSPDGQRIATGSSDHTAKIWDEPSGKELLSLQGHSDWVAAVVFSPDGRRIVTGSSDQTAKMWDADTGQEMFTFKGHTHWVTSAAFSPDGRRLVTGSHDQTAKVWDAASGKELLTLKVRRLPTRSPGIGSVAFSPDGRRIVTGSIDQTARVWDAASGKELLLPLKGHSNSIRSVAFSLNGQWIVTGSQDQMAKVWDAVSGDELRTLTGHVGRVTSAAFSPDSRRIVTGGGDRTARVWDAATGKQLLTFKGHSEGLTSVAFSPDGRRVLTGSRDQMAKIWDADGTTEVLTFRDPDAPITAAALSPDGQRLVTTGGTAKVWEAGSGREMFTFNAHGGKILCVGFSHDGQRIATGGENWTAKVWEARNGRELLILDGHTDEITSVAFSPDDRRILTGSLDQTAKMWDAGTGRELSHLKGHRSFINAVAFSPDGRLVATCSHDGTAIIWTATSGEKLQTIKGSIPAIIAQHAAWVGGGPLTLRGHSAAISSVAFSPDSDRLIMGSYDGTASVWNRASGQKLLTLNGHSSVILALSLSTDGRRIITGGHDQTVRIWETTTGKELLTLTGHNGSVNSVAFSSKGQQIVTGSGDHTAKLWQVATPQEVKLWQQDEAAAADRLHRVRLREDAAAQRARAVRIGDMGMIKQWLLLAPIALQGTNGAVAVDQEQIPREVDLRPRAGERVTVGQNEHVWRVAQLQDYLLDFTKVLGSVKEYSVAYAVCYVRSEVYRAGLVMKVGSDDQSKVYLNGREIHRRLNGRSYIADQDAVSGVELNDGLNVLVFKIVNETRGWQCSIRLTDPADQPLKGIKVTLDPDH